MSKYEKCPYCAGTGIKAFNPYDNPDNQCEHCGGTGRVARTVEMEVET